MFSSFLPFVAVLASVHSFSFVAATPEPQITPPPMAKRQNPADITSTVILTTVTADYNNLPYKVNPYKSVRGPQTGYNICNSTTEGPDSLCQTLIVENIVRLPFINSVWRV